MNESSDKSDKRGVEPEKVSPELFFATAAAALLVIFGLTALALSGAGPNVIPGQPSGVSAAYFLAIFAAATVVLLIVVRMMKQLNMVAALLRLSLVTGVSLLCWRMFGEVGAVSALPLAAILTGRRAPVWSINVAVLLASAGIAAQIGGAMNPQTAAIVLVALSVYDIIAVFGTKHMVYLAERLAKSQAVFALTVPARPAGWRTGFDQVRPGSGYGFLGVGDLVIPTLLFAAVWGNPVYAIGTAAGTLAGLALLAFVLLPKSKGIMPALPPLTLGAVLGFGLVMLFF